MNEPKHIREILPVLIKDIEDRMKQQHKSRHKRRVISAVHDFMSNLRKMKKKVSKERFLL
jgi:c-di-AMP phosphodiesterase-like protein